MESSAFVSGRARLLIDATRDFTVQARWLQGELDGVLLTHAHRDAFGGLPALARWWRQRSDYALPVHCSAATVEIARRRWRRLDRIAFEPVVGHRPVRIGNVTVTALEVPHARERRVPTFAWRLTAGGRTLVYASDVAELTAALRRFARGAQALVIDGAMWRRQLFSHLTIDRELPGLCGWPVERILLTQIGRTAPPHQTFAREVANLCRRASPAHDGFELRI